MANCPRFRGRGRTGAEPGTPEGIIPPGKREPQQESCPRWPGGLLRIDRAGAGFTTFGREAQVMDDFWQAVRDFFSEYGGRILGAALFLAVGLLLIRFLVNPLRRLLGRTRLDSL